MKGLDNTAPVHSASSILLMIQEQCNQQRHHVVSGNALRNASYVIVNPDMLTPKSQSFSTPFFISFLQLVKLAKNHSKSVHYKIPKSVLYHENSSLLKT